MMDEQLHIWLPELIPFRQHCKACRQDDLQTIGIVQSSGNCKMEYLRQNCRNSILSPPRLGRFNLVYHYLSKLLCTNLSCSKQLTVGYSVSLVHTNA